MSNSIDPDEMAHYELSHLDLCCLLSLLLTTAAKDIPICFSSGKIRLGFSCASRDHSHKVQRLIFFEKKKK